jgi:hypothetical protein
MPPALRLRAVAWLAGFQTTEKTCYLADAQNRVLERRFEGIG